MRMRPSLIPALRRCSGSIPACDVSAGRVSSVSAPPRLGAMMGSVMSKVPDPAALMAGVLHSLTTHQLEGAA